MQRITVFEGELRIDLADGDGEVVRDPSPLMMPWTSVRGRALSQVIGPGGQTAIATPIRQDARARLVAGIANARVWLDELTRGTMSDLKALAHREGCSERHVRMTLNLAFLPPDLVKAAVEGTITAGNGVVSLSDTPIAWV